jgi:parallel beta-helix repeat protein
MKATKNLKALLAAAVVIMLTIGSGATVSAAVIQVSEGESIQAAINSANPGDTIIVHDGVYTENVVVNKSDIRIRSAKGLSFTIIEPNRTDMHVFNITDQSNVTLDGLTIRDAAVQSSVLSTPSDLIGAAQRTCSILVLPPEYQTGSISVTSEPSGATVFLEGFVGPQITTPHTFTNVQIGYYEITVSLEGYYDWSRKVQVQTDQTTYVHAVLTPKHKPTPTPQATGAISVNSDPSGASIGLDGQWWGMLYKTPETLTDVESGYHTVELALEGYYDWSDTVPVTAGRTTHVHATLTPKPTPTPPPPTKGTLRIESSPSGAKVELDGQTFVGPISTTPATIPNLSPGTHTVKLSLDGYYDWGPNQVVVKAGETKKVHATMTPIPTTGSISVHSSPSGATIYLEGFVGPKITTPYTFTKVAPGDYNLKLTLEGYHDWATTVEVKASHTEQVYATLDPISTTGSISVFSSPSGADVYLDNKYQGLTHCTITNVPPGYHTIKLTRTGYQDFSTVVKVTVGKTTPVHATLKPTPTPPPKGAISLTSAPPGASIELDGKPLTGPISVTPALISDLSSGTHTIKLTLGGYQDWSTTVEVRAGETVPVHATLIPVTIRAGIYMHNASDCLIQNYEIINLTARGDNRTIGIALYNSSGNFILNGVIINCGQGVEIASGINNTIEGNIIRDNEVDAGVRLETSAANTEIHENCFINNALQAWDDGANNDWMLNYWSPPPGGPNDYTISGTAGSEDSQPQEKCPQEE